MAEVKWVNRKQLDKIEKELDYLKTHAVWVGFVGGEADATEDMVLFGYMQIIMNMVLVLEVYLQDHFSEQL